MYSFKFALPTKIIFGVQEYENSLGAEAQKLGKSCLIVTGPNINSKTNYIRTAEAILKDRGISYDVFDGVEDNPSDTTIIKGHKLYQKIKADFILGVGGGSPLDAAKAIGILESNGGKISDYFGVEKVTKPNVPVICAPTTSGTGAEVTKYSNINVPKEKTKNLINSINICPTVAIVDPTLTLSMPSGVAAVSGVDALTHVVESYTCTFTQPITEMINIEAIKIIAHYLPQSVTLQNDFMAHVMMSYASMLGGMAINNAGTGIAHGLSFPLTAHYGVPHGVATGILLPYVMEFNMPTNYAKFAKIAEAMGENIDGLSLQEAAELAPLAVKRLFHAIDFRPRSLAEFKVTDAQIKKYADNLMSQKQKLANNPRMPDYDDIVRIAQQGRDIGIEY
jgi:alcohol dehydrogenase class IV